MAKKYYCSYCGTRLEWTRKSLQNKAIIVDLIGPHECDERNAENIEDATLPVDPPTATEPRAETEGKPFPIDSSLDKRDKKDIKSTAPHGVLDSVKNAINTQPDKPIEE